MSLNIVNIGMIGADLIGYIGLNGLSITIYNHRYDKLVVL